MTTSRIVHTGDASQNGFLTRHSLSFNFNYEHYSKPHMIEKKKSPLAASNASR
jgi:hypothetical protein